VLVTAELPDTFERISDDINGDAGSFPVSFPFPDMTKKK